MARRGGVEGKRPSISSQYEEDSEVDMKGDKNPSVAVIPCKSPGPKEGISVGDTFFVIGDVVNPALVQALVDVPISFSIANLSTSCCLLATLRFRSASVKLTSALRAERGIKEGGRRKEEVKGTRQRRRKERMEVRTSRKRAP